jgi:hypothetical protein
MDDANYSTVIEEAYNGLYKDNKRHDLDDLDNMEWDDFLVLLYGCAYKEDLT